jgi:uncharacterized protein
VPGAKFRDYFDYKEALNSVPSHRALALFRGRTEEFLRLSLKLPEEIEATETAAAPAAAPATAMSPNSCELKIAARYRVADQGRPGDAWLKETVRWTWQVKIAWQLEAELFASLRERAEEEAIRVFGQNLNDLLLAAPAGARITMGLDPGIRTGVKVAIVDRTGKVLGTATVYPFPPKNDLEGTLRELGALAKKHAVELIGIGNGTASRETDRLAAELIKRHPELKLTKVVVSEAGASVYSASALASHELPDLDVSLRGAVSIARRLQDPLASQSARRVREPPGVEERAAPGAEDIRTGGGILTRGRRRQSARCLGSASRSVSGGAEDSCGSEEAGERSAWRQRRYQEARCHSLHG